MRPKASEYVKINSNLNLILRFYMRQPNFRAVPLNFNVNCILECSEIIEPLTPVVCKTIGKFQSQNINLNVHK